MEKKNKASICLVMIVKDESKVIERCLESVKDYIDYWVICDTGSTDGTQDVIKGLMDGYGIPGELHESEWKDFGTNRTESMSLSFGKCDYRLVIDADDYLDIINPEKLFTNLDKDAYRFKIILGQTSYFRHQLVKSSQDWKYIGVLHEFIEGPEDTDIADGFIEDAIMIASTSENKDAEGKEKYYHDALIFEKELETNSNIPDDLKSRYQFYLGQSYRDAQMYEKSIEAYQKRVDMEGWEEEVYISLYMIAKIKSWIQRPNHEILEAFMLAWEYRPVRLEAAYHLIRFLVSDNKTFIAFTIASTCIKMCPCEDLLFVEPDIWTWKMVDEYSILAYLTGNIKEAYNSTKSLLALESFENLLDSDKERIKKNHSIFQGIFEEKNKV